MRGSRILRLTTRNFRFPDHVNSGALAGSFCAPNQDVGLRREGGEPPSVQPTPANGMASLGVQCNAGLQQHRPDDQDAEELKYQSHWMLPFGMVGPPNGKSEARCRADGATIPKTPSVWMI